MIVLLIEPSIRGRLRLKLVAQGQSLPDEKNLGAVEFGGELSSMRKSEMF
jgi:hypothetical protein